MTCRCGAEMVLRGKWTEEPEILGASEVIWEEWRCPKSRWWSWPWHDEYSCR